ncbi:MAG: flippase-like domain-containing protein, partial [Desulfurococcales archaeon]|nr:flippase-like domain-containing protein [Desulfurococcales archaeon]
MGSGAATYMLAVIIYIASTLLWALRWHLALKRLGSRVTFLNVYTAIMGGILFNNITPSLKFGGEGFRAGWLRATEDVPVERSFITIIYERVTEIPGIAIVLIVALFSSTGRLSTLAASLPAMVGLAHMPVMIRDKMSSVKRRLGGDVKSLLRDWSLTLAASSIGIAIWLQDIARFYL